MFNDRLSSKQWAAGRNAFVDAMSTDPDLSPSGFRIGWRLISAMNPKNKLLVWPSAKTLARDTGLSERQVRRALKQLCMEAGYFQKVPGHNGYSTRYVPNIHRTMKDHDAAEIWKDIAEESMTLASQNKERTTSSVTHTTANHVTDVRETMSPPSSEPYKSNPINNSSSAPTPGNGFLNSKSTRKLDAAAELAKARKILPNSSELSACEPVRLTRDALYVMPRTNFVRNAINLRIADEYKKLPGGRQLIPVRRCPDHVDAD